MGSLLGGKTTTKTKSEPWKPQGAALENVFGAAKDIYGRQKGTPFYQGDLHAGINPLTQQGIDQTGAYTGGQGAQAAGQVGSASSRMLGASDDYLKSIGAFYGRANGDPTGDNIDAAGRYADNPYITGQIDAVGSDIRRNLSEGIMPSIDREATANGGINSSRAGVAEGIAMRGGQEALTQAAAGIRSDAYNRGLDRAEGARGTNLSAMGQAAGLYGNATGQGFAGASQGQQMNLQLLDSMVRAGQISQEDAQREMDTNYARWQGEDTRDTDLLSRYYGIVGSNNWGGTSTATAKGGPGILGGILGGAATVGSFFAPGGILAKGGGIR